MGVLVILGWFFTQPRLASDMCNLYNSMTSNKKPMRQMFRLRVSLTFKTFSRINQEKSLLHMIALAKPESFKTMGMQKH